MTYFYVETYRAKSRRALYPKFHSLGFQLAPAYLLMPSEMEEVTYAKHVAAILGSNPAFAHGNGAEIPGKSATGLMLAPRLMKCKPREWMPASVEKHQLCEKCARERNPRDAGGPLRLERLDFSRLMQTSQNVTTVYTSKTKLT